MYMIMRRYVMQYLKLYEGSIDILPAPNDGVLGPFLIITSMLNLLLSIVLQ